MAEGNRSKYFKYAIGEILLVMIGILLALEVSNWIDERKEEKLELALLAELVENLNDYMKDLEENISIQQGAIRRSNIVLIHFENNLSYSDSLKKHFYLTGIEAAFTFEQNGIFQSCKEMHGDCEKRFPPQGQLLPYIYIIYNAYHQL